MRSYFPERFGNAGELNYYEQILRKSRLQIQYIKTRDKTLLEAIKSITDYQVSLIAPKNLNPSDADNYIKTIELSFENLCTSLEEIGVSRPSDLSVFQFYVKIRYFETKKKPPKETRRR